MNTVTKLSVCGLGKLGSCVAAHLASKYPVVAIDIDEKKVAAINAGQPPVEEPQLAEAIKEVAGNLRAATDFSEIADTDATFFITPTPSTEDGSFTPEFMLSAMRSVAQAVKARGKAYHLFICCSTTTPGDCERVLIPMLEEELGGPVNESFGFVYNPEFIAIGSVLKDLANPDMILIGESNAEAGMLTESIYKTVLAGQPAYARMTIIEAELTKISINTYVTMKISFTNQLRMIASALGADEGVILNAVGSDSRIGKKYLRPGLSYGGPCFPRDNRLFDFVAEKTGHPALLARATDEINVASRAWLYDQVTKRASQEGTIAVLGLAYKPDTFITTEAAGYELAKALQENGYNVYAHDYWANPSRAPETGVFQFIDSLPQFSELPNLQLVVIALPDPRYREWASTLPKAVTVLDYWK